MGICLFVNITVKGCIALHLVLLAMKLKKKQKNVKNLFEILLKLYINTDLLNNISLINSN